MVPEMGAISDFLGIFKPKMYQKFDVSLEI